MLGLLCGLGVVDHAQYLLAVCRQEATGQMQGTGRLVVGNASAGRAETSLRLVRRCLFPAPAALVVHGTAPR